MFLFPKQLFWNLIIKGILYGLRHLYLNWRFPWQSYVLSWEVEVSAYLPSYVLVWSSWSSWLLIEENKEFKFIWTGWTYDTAQCGQMGLHGTCQWGFQQLMNETAQMDKNLRGRDKNARCIIQLRLNHTMVTNNSKILANYNSKG